MSQYLFPVIIIVMFISIPVSITILDALDSEERKICLLNGYEYYDRHMNICKQYNNGQIDAVRIEDLQQYD